MSILVNEKLESAFHNYLNQLERDGSCLDDGWEGHQDSFNAGYEAAIKEQQDKINLAIKQLEYTQLIFEGLDNSIVIASLKKGLSCE